MKCLIISDIHGNWPALQAVLAAEPNIDRILCLGDLVNYGPQPFECVSWAMNLKSPSLIIQGNHDRDFAWDNEPHCAPANIPFANATSEATNSLLTLEMKRFLAELHPIQEFPWDNVRCVACHLRVKGPLSCPFAHQNEKWPWESDIVLLGVPGRLFSLVGHPDMLLVGHTHAPLESKWGATLVINPGSVGFPADGDPRASYAIWHDGEVEFHRIAYDIEQTIRAYDTLKLEATIKTRLAESLRSGTRWAKASITESFQFEKRGELCRA